ncbi:MAG: efflux RND transporter permease subunit [Planctomycetes bacterium]|nr:efflux RND transporter permease subunit [Planctomycetota bacterium]
MWLVNFALRNPYAIGVGMMLTVLLGWRSYLETPTDILPQIRTPVVVVFLSYRGMPAPDMERSVTTVLERALTKVDHLEHIESRSILGIGIIKVYFRPQVDPDVATSQVISIVNGEMQNMPPGMLPPTIMKYDASAIPVGNLLISSDSKSDKELLDFADHRLREELAGIDGLASAPVFGGVFRQVQIYVHPRALEALRLSPLDVARIVNNQSLVLPTGEIRIGNQTYYVSSNSMAGTPKDFEKLPLFNDGRKIVFLGDVAEIVDSSRWRTNIVQVNGQRAVYMPLLRQAGASAIRVVDNVHVKLKHLYKVASIPEDIKVEVAFDQSRAVRDAMDNLRLEGILGAVLAALVVLLFLGNLRVTLNVALAIPLSVCAALIGLYFTGHTLNIMTLGGLALILGRVVDDAIVDVENTIRHLNMGKGPLQAARDSAEEVSLPVLMATVTTVIVFFPLTFMTGVGKYLFTPLAVSATLAMVASYIVARSVSPLLCAMLLRPHHEEERFSRWVVVAAVAAIVLGVSIPMLGDGLVEILPEGAASRLDRVLSGAWFDVSNSLLVIVGGITLAVAVFFWAAPRFDRGFERFTNWYENVLRICLRRWTLVAAILVGCLLPAIWCTGRISQELFPEVDASEFTLHMRLKGGPRVETTEQRVSEILRLITHGYTQREKIKPNEDPQALKANGYTVAGDHKEKLVAPIVPPEDLILTLANVGVSSRWSAIYTPNNGPHAAFIRVQLRSGFNGRSTPTRAYVQKLRTVVEERYPGDDFFFETGGMIRRILNGGAAAPIEVQVSGRDTESLRAVARVLDTRISRLPLVTDTYLPQSMDLSQLRIEVDRIQAARLKLSQTDVIRNVITALMSSAQLSPNFWIDPASGNPYIIGVQYAEHLVENIQTLENVPLSATKLGGTDRVPLLRDVAKVVRTQAPVELFHQDVHRVNQIYVSVADQDLAGTARKVEEIVAELPVNYALWKLPRSKYLDHAVARFPKDKGDPNTDADLYELLESYFVDENDESGRELEEKYKVSPQSLDLAHNEAFLEDLAYYTKKGRDRMRQKIKQDYGFDPMPLRISKDIEVQVRGEIASMRDSFGEMGLNLVLAVVLVYLILAAQFGSWLDPLIMIVAAPLGLIGVVFTLWLTGTSLNIQSSMGVLMMIGISVSNSVLVLEFANRKFHDGLTPCEAVAQAARTRLRPILMTTAAAIVALLPMSIHRHPGDEMNLPLGRAIIGGLAGSTILTLFVVPVLYVLLKRRRQAPSPSSVE